jgi:hypothetical protein
MAQVTARLELVQVVAGPPMVGRLWNISAQGGCIAIPGARQLQVPARGQLHVHDPMTHELHLLEVELRWTTALSHTTFIGVLFVAGPHPKQTFLASYMSRSWTDAVPRSSREL